MQEVKLFMMMLGCRPAGRNTEQHDMFFGIAPTIRDLVPDIKAFWPEAKGNIHVDAWREVTQVNGYQVQVLARTETQAGVGEDKLFFLNLGGYKAGEFDEFHYKMLVVAANRAAATAAARKSAFYKHTGFKGATSHIDDKFGVDVDELYQVKDILGDEVKRRYSIHITPHQTDATDELHLGYFTLDKL